MNKKIIHPDSKGLALGMRPHACLNALCQSGRLLPFFLVFFCLGQQALAQYAFNRTMWRVETSWGVDHSSLTSSLDDATFSLGPFVIAWRGTAGESELTIHHMDAPSRPLFASLAGRAFLLAGTGKEHVTQNAGSAVIRDRAGGVACIRQTVDSILPSEDGGRLVISGQLSGPNCHTHYEMILQPVGDRRLSFDIRVPVTPRGFVGRERGRRINRLFLRMKSSADEGLYGFGEQFGAINMKGRAVPIFGQEKGHLRGLPPFSALLNLRSYGTSGEWYTTYAPMPYFIGSKQRGMFLENEDYALFDLTRAGEIEVRVWADRMRGQFLYGATLLDQIEAFTAYAGRMKPLPDWSHRGAIVGMMGGSARVRKVYNQLRSAGANIAAFWLQDWVGTRHTPFGTRLWWNWEVDDASYPDWGALTHELAGDGIAVMGYINPYLADPAGKTSVRTNYFQQALAAGFLVRDARGRPARVNQGGFDAVMVDLTNPAARSWLKEILRTQIIGNGMRGWMADFGEALPYRSQLYSGEDSAGYHNHYAEEWAALNREVLQETGHEGELFFFSRSGFTRSPGKSTLFWSGDQLASWDAYDGLGSAIVALLTSGLSGISLNHWDIGGYAGIDLVIHKALPPFKITRSKELLLRWLEITPFTALMRTHEGTPPEDHHQISSSPEATAAFAFSSRVFAALFDYRRGLMQEAATRGYPLVRHPMLHYPDDATCALLSDQFMLGDAFMVAPVVVPGAMERRLYLPRGVWVHLWSGVTFDMGQLGGWLTILAPVGKPAVFFRQDAAAGWRLYRQTQAMMSSAPEPVQPLTGTHHG